MVDPIHALRKKRMEGMAPEVPGEVAEVAPEGEMAEYWARLEAMDAKIDQILEAVVGPQEEVEPEVKPELPA